MAVRIRSLIFILFGFLNGDVFGGGDGDDAVIGGAASGDREVVDAWLHLGMQVLLLILDDPVFLFHRVAASQQIADLMIAGPLGSGRVGGGAGGQAESEE